MLCLTVPFTSAAVQPPGENKPRPQLPSQVGDAKFTTKGIVKNLQRRFKLDVFLLCIQLSLPPCCRLLHQRTAVLFPRTLQRGKVCKVYTWVTTRAQSYYVQLLTRVHCLVPQAFPEGNLEDVERRGPEQTDGVLSCSAGPHLLRAGQPQSKTDQWCSASRYSLQSSSRKRSSSLHPTSNAVFWKRRAHCLDWSVCHGSELYCHGTVTPVKLRRHPVFNVCNDGGFSGWQWSGVLLHRRPSASPSF